jgi:hypothetical protein
MGFHQPSHVSIFQFCFISFLFLLISTVHNFLQINYFFSYSNENWWGPSKQQEDKAFWLSAVLDV